MNEDTVLFMSKQFSPDYELLMHAKAFLFVLLNQAMNSCKFLPRFSSFLTTDS